MMVAYHIQVDNDTVGDEMKITSVVNEILHDPLYSDLDFELVNLEEYKALKASEFSDRTFLIRFSTNDTITKACNFSKLSCADVGRKIIYLNQDNWFRGDD